MANPADQVSHTPRAIFFASLVSTVLAPAVYGFMGNGPAAAIGFLMIGLTFGAPFLVLVFISAWALGSLLRRWGIRHVAAFVGCGAVLGLSAPILLGLGVMSRIGGGNNLSWNISFAAFAGGAAAGAIVGLVFWLVAEFLSRRASRPPLG